MLTDIRRDTTHWRLMDRFRGRGEGWIATTFEMLAAARVLEQEQDFLDGQEELVERGWHAIRAKAALLWKLRHGEADAVTPFGPSVAADRRPGDYEALKQVARALRTDHSEPKALLAALVDLMALTDERRGTDIFYPVMSELLADLLEAPPGARVYCAFEASAVSALHMALRGCPTTLQIPESRAHFWSGVAVAVGAAGILTVIDGDPFSAIWATPSRAFDAAIVIPPLGLRISSDAPEAAAMPLNSEAWGAMLATHCARNAICLSANALLFRTTLSEQSFKDGLLRSAHLDTVATVPGAAISPRANIGRSILRFGHADDDRVLMVDVARSLEHAPMSFFDADLIRRIVNGRDEGEISRFASYAEIADNNFNLSTDRYVLSREALRLRKLAAESPSMLLGELVDIYRPQAIPSARAYQETLPQAEAPFELTLADIGQAGLVRRPGKRTPAALSDLPKLRKAELLPGDIVMLIKGSIGKVGYVAEIAPGEMWVASQSFAVLRLRRNGPITDPRVLFRFLDSDIAQNAIQTLRVGTVMASLQMADIRRIEVLVPSPEHQSLVAHQVEELFVMQSEIAALQARLSETQKAIWPEA